MLRAYVQSQSKPDGIFKACRLFAFPPRAHWARFSAGLADSKEDGAGSAVLVSQRKDVYQCFASSKSFTNPGKFLNILRITRGSQPEFAGMKIFTTTLVA